MKDGYTLKEMMQEMRDEQKHNSLLLVKTLEHAENVDKHLTLLNSKVATNVAKITKLESFQGKAMVVWSFAVFVVVTVANKLI